MGRQHDTLAPDRDVSPADRLRELTSLLETIAGDWSVLESLPADDRRRLHQAIAAVYQPDPVVRRRRVKEAERRRKAQAAERDDDVLGDTGIRLRRRRPAVTTPNVFPPPTMPAGAVMEDAARATSSRHCYICKAHYVEVHHFYDQLCSSCAAFNFAKRAELADLRGRVALVTGGRVKIGYEAVLKLLRSGAHVIVTTRFPRNAAARYAAEVDFASWQDRLEIFGLDLRHTPSVEALCRHLVATQSRLDFLVNNACQTVRRPPEFYAHMMAGERAAHAELGAPARGLLASYEHLREAAGRAREATGGSALTPAAALSGLASAAELSQVPLVADDVTPDPRLFPEGRLDEDLQQVDLRGRNSWRLLLAEVPTVELLEVQLVNAVAPFVLNARLKPLMLRTPERDKHIVNVSAVEGQFYRNFKTTRHPHTNMAKAALNMMTRTAATDYYNDGIHMNSVDTGWVTDEDPAEIAARKTAEQRFHPPLDIVDGAARIVDPIITGFNTGTHSWGQFLKDYCPTDW